MPSSRPRIASVIAGIVAPNLLGWAVCAVYAWVFRSASHDAQLRQVILATAYPNLLLVPMAMGALTAYLWRDFKIRISLYVLASILITYLGVAGSYLALKEGAICLLIVSPLLLGGVVGGAMIGRSFFKRGDKLQLTFVPLLILLVFAEGATQRERQALVTDRLVIDAPPSEVWKHVVSFPRITAEPRHWLNMAGLPSAAETTCEGEFIGAKRACIFSNGLVFQERVAELERERLLTFEIVEQPNDPELLGHLTLRRGQFELQANAAGGTTLIGRSWYTLHVRPLWYFDWWTRSITRDVHLRVMRHIKQLSENTG